MKAVNRIVVRLSALALLGMSLSACVTTDTQAYYYNPANMYNQAAVGGGEIYGYQAVDFRALGVR